MSNEKKLRTFQELHYNPEEAFKNDEFKKLVNNAPPEKWLKKHPLAKVKKNGKETFSRYLPIDKVEYLLDLIYQRWYPEVIREGVMFNSVYVTVRVHVLNPISGEWEYYDGVGAKDIQSDSGTTLTMETIKSAGVQMALPAAKSYAIKDAVEHIGAIFGRNVNRDGVIDEFEGQYSTKENDAVQPETKKRSDAETKRILVLISAAKTKDNLRQLRPDLVTQEEFEAFEEKMKSLTN